MLFRGSGPSLSPHLIPSFTACCSLALLAHTHAALALSCLGLVPMNIPTSMSRSQCIYL